MKHLLWLLIAGGMTIGASSATAQNFRDQDPMGTDAVRHDSMNKEPMGRDAMNEHAMGADAMENRRSIPDDGMEKE